jgi:hypothetical protein
MISISSPSNYLAKVHVISSLRKHSNADRLQCTSIDGNNVITGLDAKVGDVYVYFPVECTISKEFLSATNSFRDGVLNSSPDIKGFFEDNCRVKAIKLRGEQSAGYIVPSSVLEGWFASKGLTVDFSKHSGSYFDKVGDFVICAKYVNPALLRSSVNRGAKPKKKAVESKVIPDQFRFHYDTEHLGRNIHSLQPDDVVTITQKLHGTSAVFARVKCKKSLNPVFRLLAKLGAPIIAESYDYVYSSRTVIKNMYADKQSLGFYDSDVWGSVFNKIKHAICDNITLYGEIVGYTSTGSYIQKPYDYGCAVGESKFYVYRITFTGNDGMVYDFTWNQMQDYCEKYGLSLVPILYHGKLGKLFPDISTSDHWHENVLTSLQKAYLEKKCSMCKNDVWNEGVVLKKESIFGRAYKLKCFNFLAHESKAVDAGEVDIESSESSVDSVTPA